MKKKLLVSFIVLFALTMIAASGIVGLNGGTGQASYSISKLYVSAQVDTCKYAREPGLTGLSFGIYTKDTSNFLNVIVRRVINGVMTPVIAGDTLLGVDSSATARSICKTVTLAPIPQEYWFFATFKTDNGTYLNTSAGDPASQVVKYSVQKQFATK